MTAISQEWLGILVGAGVLVAAVGVLLIMKWLVGSVDGATFVAVLLFPLIVYAVVSGRVAEFTGPGGWGAKFRTAATSQVETSGIIENAEDLQAVEKGGLRDLGRAVEQLNPDLPNALTLRVGRSGYYHPEAILRYLKALLAVGPSTYVVFVEYETGQFVGSANASQVVAILEAGPTRDDFMAELESGGEAAFEDLGFLVRESLSPDDSNNQALEKFLDTNADALVVVSVDGQKPVGIVDRNRLMTKLMVKLAGGE
jgi:hypothetical protein